MKMTKTDFAELNKAIQAVFAFSGKDEVIADYETGNFFNSDRVKDLNERFRWDMFWSCNRSNLDLNYLNDNHINTALKNIVPTITRRY